MKPDALGPHATQHGQELAGARPLAQAIRQLRRRELRPVEILLEQLVVGLGDDLDQLLARRRDLVGQLGGDRLLLHGPRVALVDEGTPGQHVDHAAELGLDPDRDLEHGGLHAEQLQILQRVLQPGALAVEPRDEADGRQPQLLAPAPHLLRLDLHLAAGRAEHQDDAGRGAETVVRVVQEGRVPGRVDQVDLVLLPRDVVQRGGDGALAPLLLGLRVERRRGVVDPSDARGRTRREQQRVGDAGLSRAALPHDGDVA